MEADLELQVEILVKMMTPEQFGEMLRVMQASIAASTPVPTNAPIRKRRLDSRYFKLQDFNGELSAGGDWCFAFKRTVRSNCVEAFEIMEFVERQTTEMVEAELGGDRLDSDEVAALSAELFDLLCQTCSGEAMTVVRGVEGCFGFVAWQRLCKKFNPKTMARAIRLMAEVCSPTRVKELHEVDDAIRRWEGKVTQLRKEFSEELSSNMRVAIVTAMMPTSIQDYIYTTVDKNILYDDLVEKVRSVVGNKVAMMSKPTPMDIGWVDEGDQGEEKEVGAVTLGTKCFGCGGWGHLSRNCPSVAKGLGKGKGGKGTTESKGGKGGKKGGGKGGFRGNCFKCGKTGHRAIDCWSANAVEQDPVEEDANEHADLGGVWVIGAVDARWPKPVSECLLSRNRYHALQDESEELEHGITAERDLQLGEQHDVETPRPMFLEYGARSARGSTRTWRCLRPHDAKEARSEMGLKANAESWTVPVMAVAGGRTMTRRSAIEFHVADVRRPLASAAKMIQAGNRIVLDSSGSFVENVATGEKMEVKVKDETFVFEVVYDNGDRGEITLDSGAGVNVWPKNLQSQVKMLPRRPGLRMAAANGTEIANLGRKVIQFRGVEAEPASAGFSRQM